MRVKMIGTGGIGSHLVYPLCQFLNWGSADHQFTAPTLGLIDGDDFDFSNKTRQRFTSWGNKAQALAEELKEEFENLEISYHPVYVDVDNISTLIQDGDVVLLCVDNHATRKLVSHHCNQLNDVTLISGGNELLDGNVMIHQRKNGKNLTRALHEVHPEINTPTDKHPNELKLLGCMEMVKSAPQLVVTNFAICAVMLNAFYAVATNKNPDYEEVYVDVVQNKSRSMKRAG